MKHVSALSITIHHNLSENQLIEIQRLRYQVYAAELNLRLASMDHSRNLMTDRMDVPATHICAKVGEKLAGVVRLNLDSVPAGLEHPLAASDLPRPFIYCARLCIHPDWRGTEVMSSLTRACFDQFAQQRAAVAVCHCYRHLTKLYARMGFRPYGSPFALAGLEELGLQTPMCRAFTIRQLPWAA